MLHGIAGGEVRFGGSTWFADVLVRFGYDLPEHDHPWQGEWIDDAFETAALRLRATGLKLIRVLDRIGHEAEDVDAEETPLSLDLAIAYVGIIVRDVSVAAPCCFGVEGRVAEAARRHGPEAVADALVPIDARAAATLRPPPELLALGDVWTHDDLLYTVVDAAGPHPALPRAVARVRADSAAVSVDAVRRLDGALCDLCRWLDRVVPALQSAVCERAEDGADLRERWAIPDWAVLGPASPRLARHLPAIG